MRGGRGRAQLPSRQVAAPAAIKGNFDLQAALRADGLVAGLVPSAASSAAATAATATAAAAGAVLAPQSLLRGLSEGDTHQLLTAIKQGPEAVTACVEQLGSVLGFDSAQRGTIVQLAQTLARGQGALLSAQSALSQAQQQQARTERALQQLQQQRGLPPQPVKSAIADPKGSALEQPQPEWAQFPQQTITPEGEGPQGGIGPGFTAPSLQERVAAAAHAAQQAAQQAQKQNVAADAAAPAATPASAPAAPVPPQGTDATLDFLKKVDTDSKFDYSDQQKDLAAIRAGAGGFTTKVLDLNQLEKSEPLHDAAEAAASQLIMETLPQVRSYFQLLETESKQLEQEFGGGNSKKGVNYDSELTSVVAGIRKARSDIDAGIKPSVPPSVNDSSSLTLAAASEQGTSDFSLTQQTSSGFDVNDPRNLGAQLVGSVSLAANESAAAPGGSFELPTSAPTAQPTLPAASQSTLPAASQPTFPAAAQSTAPAALSPLPVPPSVGVAEATPSAASDELSHKLLARAAALADDAPAPVSVVATPQPLSTEVNRSLQAMVSSLQAAEGHSADDLSIDDIMGSDLGSESLSALTPVNVAAVPASAPSAAPLSAGVQSTPADLPPWPVKSNLQTIAPESAAVGAASSSSLSLEPTTAGAPLAPQTAPSAPVPIDAQVLLPSSPMVNESSGQVSVVGQAHDAALLNPEAAAQQAMRTAAQNLEQLDHARSSAQPLSDDERHAQQQKLASAAMDALSSLGQQLEQDLESSGNTGPSPWDELSSVTVLSVDERSIEIKFPKQEKLARISDHNMLVQESAEAVASSAHVFTTTLKLCFGEKWPEQGVNAIVERLERELHCQQEQQAAEQAAHEAWLQKFKEQVAAGAIREGASADFQAVLATRHAALAATSAPVTTAPSFAPNAGSEPVPAALHPAQPEALAAPAAPQFPAQPEALAAPAAPQFPSQPEALAAPAAPQFPSQPEALAAPAAPQFPSQPEALAAPAAPQFPAQPEALAAPAAPQFPAQPQPQPQPQVAPTAGPDFGALPDYIAEAQEYLGDAASYAAMGEDNGGGDDDDDINDVDFGQAGAQQGLAQAPEAGADLAEMALVQRAQDAPAAAASALPVRLEISEVPGRRRLNQDDFLDLVALEDPWFQLLLQVFPDRGPVFATLTGVQRLIDPSNPNHWRLGIDRKVDLSFVDPDFWNNMQQRFEQHLHTKLQIEVELLDMMPQGAPVQLALIKEHEAQVHAKADVQKIKPLNNLLKIMGENWDRVGIELYHSGKLPLSLHH